MSSVVMEIIGLVNGESTPFDGQYVKDYSPDPREGHVIEVNGRPLACYLVTTPTQANAKHYPNLPEAHRDWAAVSRAQPTRADGQPNRPLTAFNVTMTRVE